MQNASQGGISEGFLNELQGLSRKAFIGIGFSEGHAEDAIDMVTWMESYDLQGLDALYKGLEHLIRNDPETLPRIVYQDGDLAVVDGQDLECFTPEQSCIRTGLRQGRRAACR